LRGELDLTTEELAAKQEELSLKKETKVLRFMLQLLVLQYEYHKVRSRHTRPRCRSRGYGHLTVSLT